MVAVVAVGRRGVRELLKVVRLRKHLGGLPEHLAFHQQLHGGALVDGAPMAAHDLRVERHLSLENEVAGRALQMLPPGVPPQRRGFSTINLQPVKLLGRDKTQNE